MKSLPNVTLISYDNSATPEKTLKSLQYCQSLIQFADVVIVCNRKPSGLNGEYLKIVPETGYFEAMKWEVAGVVNHVQTDFALCIHHDGYIINPQAWRDEWLQYDFIGAPWPREPNGRHPGKSNFPNRRVGNTGFCLKSRRFMERTAELENIFDTMHRLEGTNINWRGLGGDTFCCQYQRPVLEGFGLKFAPVEVAADFSWEDNIEEFPSGRPDAFGFHNFNLAGKTVPRV